MYIYVYMCIQVCAHVYSHVYVCLWGCARAQQRVYLWVLWCQPTPRVSLLTPAPRFSPPRAGQDGGGRGEWAAGAMATGADVRDILELGGVESENTGTINKKDIINSDKVKCGVPTAAAPLLGAGWPCVWWVLEERWKKARSVMFCLFSHSLGIPRNACRVPLLCSQCS